MSISSRREYVLATLAARELRRTIRRFREQLQAETDPIAYYSLLADIAFAQAQLNDLFSQTGEWVLRGGCLADDTPSAAPRERGWLIL